MFELNHNSKLNIDEKRTTCEQKKGLQGDLDKV